MPYSPTPKGTNRASASPSISSLINPPSEAEYVSSNRLPQTRLGPSHTSNGFMPSPASPVVGQGIRTSGAVSSGHEMAAARWENAGDDSRTYPTESSIVPDSAEKKPAAGTSTSTNASSSVASPKPARQKAAPPPPPQGNGLLSSALFGGPTSAPAPGSAENKTPTIILDVPLKGETNMTINFAKMAEERYGFNALYPRIAAQQERLARVAAAGAALEQGSATASADEMSVDLSEPESNVDMGGTGTGAESATGTKRKRAAKTEEYDKDDPFVDDSEMLWEEQAAASKDGFFVYSGPLVPEGEKPTIERASGTVKRGRGRGRGGATRGSTTARAGAAAASGETKRPASGPGSRGGAVARKPRIKKADLLMMEQEKQQREKVAPLAAKPSTYVG